MFPGFFLCLLNSDIYLSSTAETPMLKNKLLAAFAVTGILYWLCTTKNVSSKTLN